MRVIGLPREAIDRLASDPPPLFDLRGGHVARHVVAPQRVRVLFGRILRRRQGQPLVGLDVGLGNAVALVIQES
jgi:hypothetical protein